MFECTVPGFSYAGEIRRIVLLYGILNALLYSALLPLWEGFDEIFHYGNVQFLSSRLELPRAGRAFISEEIWHSMELAPLSNYVQGYTKAPLNFTDYFSYSQERRLEQRQKLRSLPAGEKYIPHESLRAYEATQAPLAYLIMAVPDRRLSGFALPVRVLVLRLLASIAAVSILFWATFALAARLDLPEAFAAASMFCIFSSQMLYATVAHVCNDGLAVALMPVLILAGVLTASKGSARNHVLFGAALAAALLAKAYFLFLLPFGFGVVAWQLWRRRSSWRAAAWFSCAFLILAGPWYARNWILYHNLSGTVESTTGVGLREIVTSAARLPWSESIGFILKSSLWTGNNSFTTFSANTLYVVLALLFASLCFYAARFKAVPAEICVLGATLLFCCGLFAISIAFFSSSGGRALAPEPWYPIPLLAPVLLMAFLGNARMAGFGRWIAAAMVLLATYVLCATYLAKLLPLYGGMPQGPAHFRDLWEWYVHHAPERGAILGTTCLAGPAFLYAMTAAVVALSIALCVALLMRVLGARRSEGV